MRNANRILVSLDRHEGAAAVLEKAVAIASTTGAVLDVVHIVYSDIVDLPLYSAEKNQALKNSIMETGEAWLEDQLASIISEVKDVESNTVWNKNKWATIIEAAEERNADLIIKGISQIDEARSLIRTPEDSNLIRHSNIPVALVRGDAWVEKPMVLVAIDALNEDQVELNQRVLVEAKHLSNVLNGDLAIAVTYPMLDAWAVPVALESEHINLRSTIERAIREKVDALAKGLGINFKSLHIKQGNSAVRIRDLVQETGAAMLVIGTVGRTGIKGLVIGNTSETILHYTSSDVLVIR